MRARQLQRLAKRRAEKSSTTNVLSPFEELQKFLNKEPDQTGAHLHPWDETQQLINKMLAEDRLNYSSESSDCKDVEFASDDEVEEEEKGGRRRGKKDEEFAEEDLDMEEDPGDDVYMDELENESLSASPRNKRGYNSSGKKKGPGRNLAKSADLGDDDEAAVLEGNTIFIDNLPSDVFSIQRMKAEAKRLIKQLEQQFFLEEDSDREENLKSITNVSKHEEALHAFKEMSSVKNFWCIPLSVDVRTLNFRAIAEAQMEHGGRAFDIVTCDPPW